MSKFTQTANTYGRENLKEALALVDWYTGTLYPQFTGNPHEAMSRGKAVTFATKVLDFMRETDITWEQMRYVLINVPKTDAKDPTIYLATSPKVMGYWLLTHPDIGWDSLAHTEYQPVEEYY